MQVDLIFPGEGGVMGALAEKYKVSNFRRWGYIPICLQGMGEKAESCYLYAAL